MAKETWLQRKVDSVAGRVGYETERVILNVNEQIHALMETQGITRTELAQQLHVSKSSLSKMLSGAPNLTLRTLVSVANVLGCRVSIALTQSENGRDRTAQPISVRSNSSEKRTRRLSR